MQPDTKNELRRAALGWLSETDPKIKSAGVIALSQEWAAGRMGLETDIVLASQQVVPGNPQRPELVSHLDVPRRSMRTMEGRAALIHALTHIEFNAINLALDAIWRFAAMPPDYYTDWLKVAAEESRHFSLLVDHLGTKGYAYGDFAAHSGLWDMVEKTSDDVLARMALVPRTMEARGLDASPPLRAKLWQAGETDAAKIIDIILADEIGHVLIGNRWFNWICEVRLLDPVTTYALLAKQYKAPKLRGPFNLDARRAAGFSEDELIALAATE